MLVFSNYYPQNKRPGRPELEGRETYTEDLSTLTLPLEQLDNFFKLLIKAEEDYAEIAFIGQVLVKHAVMQTEEYIKVLRHEFGDVRFYCAMENNKAGIPAEALVKVGKMEKKTIAA